MLEFPRQLSASGKLNYVLWRLGGKKNTRVVTLKSGLKFYLRRNDSGVAYEIFVRHAYQPPVVPPTQNPLIVDLGAHVGFATLYLMGRIQNARVIAFEAHPGHAEQYRRNMALNGLSDRVELHATAASNADGEVKLSDFASMSSATRHRTRDMKFITVPRRDIFTLLLGRRIDIFKMDIEGGEYEILSDGRFGQLDIRCLVMEWHKISEARDDCAWVFRRLDELGYAASAICTREKSGELWAVRKATQLSIDHPGSSAPSLSAD